jgi:hypothetical protein
MDHGQGRLASVVDMATCSPQSLEVLDIAIALDLGDLVVSVSCGRSRHVLRKLIGCEYQELLSSKDISIYKEILWDFDIGV